jgi:hypothetical protein
MEGITILVGSWLDQLNWKELYMNIFILSLNKPVTTLRTLAALLVVAWVAFFVLFFPTLISAYSNPILDTSGGSGQKNDPILISTVEQFVSFRDSVNRGYNYNGLYFLQTADFDLTEYSPWVPIGEYASGFYFYGNYDGNGHTINNLICTGENSNSVNVGLFGQLGGAVINLGIESGQVSGDCVGSIASHSAGGDAKIINCYSKANVYGINRAGGIADNFVNGQILNSWFGGTIAAIQIGGIASYNASLVYSCFSHEPLLTDTFTGISENIEILPDNQILTDRLNEFIGGQQAEYLAVSAVGGTPVQSRDLCKWVIAEDDNIKFLQ